MAARDGERRGDGRRTPSSRTPTTVPRSSACAARRAPGRRLDEDGARLVPHFPALVEDLFCALFKMNVVALPAEQVAPSAALNQRVLAGVATGSGVRDAAPAHACSTRRAPGLGAVLIGEAVLRALREDRVLTSGDLLDLWNLQREEDAARDATEEAEVGRELADAANERTARGRAGAGRARARRAGG